MFSLHVFPLRSIPFPQTSLRPILSSSLFEGNVRLYASPWQALKKDSWITLTDSSQNLKICCVWPTPCIGQTLKSIATHISHRNSMLNMNTEYPLMNCIRAFFFFLRCLSSIFFSLADISTAAAKRKCKVCWDVHLFEASKIELREMRGHRWNCLQSTKSAVF